MKWIILKCALIVYMTSLVIFVVYFPEKTLTGNERDEICEQMISDVRKYYEDLMNQTSRDQNDRNGSTSNLPELVQVVEERVQYGPGAYGEDAELSLESLDPDEHRDRGLLIRKHDYDAFVSDVVSIYRIIPDTRPDVCRNITYSDLPEVSIIIPFRDERLSVLLRTIYSILQNTPRDLLAEILLIDDGSKTLELKAKLDYHVDRLSMVEVIRMNESVGLMTARQTGIDRSKAEYFITMDCHIEVVTGWLEPLLHRLKENPKACLLPNVGIIKRDNFGVDMTSRWTFNKFPMFAFNLDEAHSFYWNDFLEGRDRSKPIPTGINQGMAIAMKKSWFLQLGGFDTGMKVWGSEQIELSVKVWTCGGTVEIIPCSYIAHLFKRKLVWKMGDARFRNILRFAEVWMDEYKEYIYDYWPTARQAIDPGSLTERKVIRRMNRCKPFQYYIDKVREFGFIHFPKNLHNKGWIISQYFNQCITLTRHGVILETCHKKTGDMQFFEHTDENQLRHIQQCLYPADLKEPNTTGVIFEECETVMPEKLKWVYTENSELMHPYKNECLTVAEIDMTFTFTMETCSGKPNQRWTWQLWNG
ncbi:Polypeptide N-acetylgalactosaminyltransferase 4 [Mactra antiquata]